MLDSSFFTFRERKFRPPHFFSTFNGHVLLVKLPKINWLCHFLAVEVAIVANDMEPTASNKHIHFINVHVKWNEDRMMRWRWLAANLHSCIGVCIIAPSIYLDLHRIIEYKSKICTLLRVWVTKIRITRSSIKKTNTNNCRPRTHVNQFVTLDPIYVLG